MGGTNPRRHDHCRNNQPQQNLFDFLRFHVVLSFRSCICLLQELRRILEEVSVDFFCMRQSQLLPRFIREYLSVVIISWISPGRADIMTIRSPNRLPRQCRCVTMTMVTFSSRWIRRISFCIWIRVSASSAPNGSSSSNMDGFPARPLAIATRWDIPPDSCEG